MSAPAVPASAAPMPVAITDILRTLTPMSWAASRSWAVARIAWPVSVLMRNQYSTAVMIAVITNETARGIEIDSPPTFTLLDE